MAHAETRKMLNDPRADIGTAAASQRYALDMPGLAAFAIYLGLAFLFFARGLVGRFSTAYIGKGVDPTQFMWLLAWWPHAIRNGLNPLYSRAIWAPHGINLAWTTCMPLLSLLLAPVVLLCGPAFAYNIACLLAVALAGWSAFILCRYVTAAYWPSLAGGYVFGFSTYMVVHAIADLNLLLVFAMPLLGFLLLRAFRNDIGQRSLFAGLVLLLLAQFLLFIELFVTMTMLLGIALLGVLILGRHAERQRTLSLLPTIGLSYLVTLLLISPYLYCMFSLGYERGAVHPALLYSTDLLNLIVPTQIQELGTVTFFRQISSRFLGYPIEATGFIGLPLLVVGILFVQRWRTESWDRLLVFFCITATALSLGPFLLIGGHPLMPLPGIFVALTPLISKALPARFMLYAFLGLALVTAIWLNTNHVSVRLRQLAALIIILSLLPNISANFWVSAFDVPRFFSEGLYSKYLKHRETVVTLPYGINGQSMAWQLASHWYFRMAGGYTGIPPLEFRRWPAVRTFYHVDTVALPAAGDQLRAFFAAHHVSTVLVDDHEAEFWQPLMATLSVAPIHEGGMTLYRIPPKELAPWAKATAFQMETLAARMRFAALLVKAEVWLRSAKIPDRLTPAQLLKAGAAPPGWIIVKGRIPHYAEWKLNLPARPPNPHVLAGMLLAANSADQVEVGVVSWPPVLRAIVNEYRTDAVNFTPHDLSGGPKGARADRREMLTMTFNADGFKRAAAKAASFMAASTHSQLSVAPTAKARGSTK